MSAPLLLLGAGASGLSAARLAAGEGGSGQTFSDQPPEAPVLTELEALGFPWRGDLPESGEGKAILSPGIPIDHPRVRRLRERDWTVLPEFEWAASRLRGVQIAVTGSLGKTSMVLLGENLLRRAGYRVTVSGNIGRPVSEVARVQPEADFHLLELSSFQLESVAGYRPERALCLNLFPNHLDRHPDLNSYAAAKAKLFLHQTAEDLAVWPADFPVEVVSRARRAAAEDRVLPALDGTAFDTPALRGNLRGLVAVLDGIPGLDDRLWEQTLKAFQFPPHRMQRLTLPGAGRVIDDSKSTCLNATRAALEATPGAVQLVMGGLDKGEALDTLLPIFRERNPSLYLFGRSAKKMRAVWQDSVDECRGFDSLPELMSSLWQTRTDAQTLLFSPGCASFDQYPGYAVRGQHFQELVAGLAAKFPI